MRRFIPSKTDLAKLPTRRLRRSIAAYNNNNNTPRKCLDFRTLAEAFSQLLHNVNPPPLSAIDGARPICAAELAFCQHSLLALEFARPIFDLA